MVDVVVVRRRAQAVYQPGGRDGREDLAADELHRAHFPLDAGLGAEDSAFAGEAVDLLGRFGCRNKGDFVGVVEGGNVDRWIAGSVALRWRPLDVGACRWSWRRRARIVSGPGLGAFGGTAGITAIVLGPAPGVDECLVREGYAPEHLCLSTVIGVGFPGSLAVGHFDLFVRRGDGYSENLIVRTAALGQARALL